MADEPDFAQRVRDMLEATWKQMGGIGPTPRLKVGPGMQDFLLEAGVPPDVLQSNELP